MSATALEQQGIDLRQHLAEYKDKLIRFNSTDKYRMELVVLEGLLYPMSGRAILDYGCGIGTAVEYFRGKGLMCFGYDRFNYFAEQPEWFVVETSLKFDTVYFMHSLAHIDALDYKLQSLKEVINPGAEIVVITPNEDWMKAVGGKDYIPDPTVIQHFTGERLRKRFEDNGYKVLIEGQFGAYVGPLCERLFIKTKYEG